MGPLQLRLRRMFDEMVIPKDASRIPEFYSPSLQLITNQQRQDYAQFLTDHQHYYASPITYGVEYDDDSWVEEPTKVACRMWITTARPDHPATRIEVLLIAQFDGELISKIWELTLPNWATLEQFSA